MAREVAPDLDLAELQIPIYRPVAARLLEKYGRFDTADQALITLILSDPGLCCAVLTAANSISATPTVEDAVTALDMDATVTIALTACLSSPPDRFFYEKLDPVRFWKDSVRRGLLAQALARHIQNESPRIAMVAGLVCDIGLLAGSQRQITGDPEVSQRVLQAWGWPVTVSDLVAQRDRLPAPDKHPDLAGCLYLANHLATFPALKTTNTPLTDSVWTPTLTLFRLDVAGTLAILQQVERTLQELEQEVGSIDTVRTSWPALQRPLHTAVQKGIVRLGMAARAGVLPVSLLAKSPQTTERISRGGTLQRTLEYVAQEACRTLGVSEVAYTFHSSDGRTLTGASGINAADEMCLPCSAPIDAGEWRKGALVAQYRVGIPDLPNIQNGLTYFAALAGPALSGLRRVEHASNVAPPAAKGVIPPGPNLVEMDAAQLQDLNDMAAQIAHVFNNLFTGILGRAQLLLKRPEDRDKTVAGLRIIEQSIVKGSQIIRRLQLASQTTPISLGETVLVDRIARQVLEEKSGDLEASGINIVVEMDDRFPSVVGRANEIHLMLTEIVQNSMEAMPDGGTLTIIATAGLTTLTVTVSDTGSGLPDGAKEQIFKPLLQPKAPRASAWD